jgi:hypothetical protein
VLTEGEPVASFVETLAGTMIQRRSHGVAQFISNHVFIIKVFALRVGWLEALRHAFTQRRGISPAG